tara:strand:+ start:4463 stop:4729 length:267 start_codon:yes stop_codon:yes gene_type:complete
MAERKDEESPDDDIYNEADREDQLDDSEITPAEAGFMEGYENPKMLQCGTCGKNVDLENSIERVIHGKTYWFCSEKCSNNFEDRKARD